MDRRYKRQRVATAFLLFGLLGSTGMAQQTPQGDPSPLAPGDLKRPIFDTSKRIVDTSQAETMSADLVVAEVDGRTITLGDVSDAISDLPPNMRSLPFEQLYPGVLDQLVQQKALVIRAQQQAVDEDPEVRRKIKAATNRILAEEIMRHELMPTITEQALLDRYNKDIANKPGPEEVHLRVIMTPTEEKARDLIAELKAGADFAAVAKRSSTDASASVGGDLGFLRMDKLNAEVGSAAFVLQAGQFTPYPFRSSGGWFIVKVEERRVGKAPSFAEAREQLIQTMLREGVDGVAARAMKTVTVHEYSINGKETTANSPK